MLVSVIFALHLSGAEYVSEANRVKSARSIFVRHNKNGRGKRPFFVMLGRNYFLATPMTAASPPAIKDGMFGDMAESMTEDAGGSFGDLLDQVTSDEFKESMDIYKQLIDEAEKAGLEGEKLDELKTPYEIGQKSVAIVAFGLLTVLLLAVATVACALSQFVNIGFLRFIVMIAGVLALISGIIAVALTGSILDLGETLGEIADATVKPVIGAGAALLAVGGIVGGLSGVVSFFFGKKKK